MSDFIKGREAEKEIGKSLERAPGQKAKRPTRQPLAIEVCCGHAGLSAALRIKGWDVRPIDWVGNEHETKIPVLHKDLTDSVHVNQVLRMVKRASYVHMAPPCELQAEHETGGYAHGMGVHPQDRCDQPDIHWGYPASRSGNNSRWMQPIKYMRPSPK